MAVTATATTARKAFREWLQATLRHDRKAEPGMEYRLLGTYVLRLGRDCTAKRTKRRVGLDDRTRTISKESRWTIAVFNPTACWNAISWNMMRSKQHSPDIPVTTNLMGTFKELDYFKWAKYMDVVSWDNYPRLDTPVSLHGNDA